MSILGNIEYNNFPRIKNDYLLNTIKNNKYNYTIEDYNNNLTEIAENYHADNNIINQTESSQKILSKGKINDILNRYNKNNNKDENDENEQDYEQYEKEIINDNNTHNTDNIQNIYQIPLNNATNQNNVNNVNSINKLKLKNELMKDRIKLLGNIKQDFNSVF